MNGKSVETDSYVNLLKILPAYLRMFNFYKKQDVENKLFSLKKLKFGRSLGFLFLNYVNSESYLQSELFMETLF